MRTGNGDEEEEEEGLSVRSTVLLRNFIACSILFCSIIFCYDCDYSRFIHELHCLTLHYHAF
jgi:hypothetical protein